jgi:signal transduction histidine kinase
VTNTGPAIPTADIDRLFQPFQRLAPHRGSRPDGTGLGLSIVKAIADAHDATITATPQPHGGLKMEVSFPPQRPSHQTPSRAPSSSGYHRPSIRVAAP